MSKRKKPNPPSPVVPPPVAEAATEVQPEYPPCFPYVPDAAPVYFAPEPIVCEPVPDTSPTGPTGPTLERA